MTLPSLKDVVELNDLAQSIYLRLPPEDYVGKLAPSLGALVAKDLEIARASIGVEFTNPIMFLSITYFRPALKEALQYVNHRLNIPSASVIPLTHAMGLGKTHFLVLLYHLYVNVPNYWQELSSSPELQEIYEVLVSETVYRFDVAQKTLVIPIDLKFLPPGLDPYKALAEIAKKVFQKKKEYLRGIVAEKHLNTIEQLLAELPSYDPVDAAKKFSKLIKDTGIVIPILILVDELYASIIDAVWGASPSYIESLKKTLLFIQNVVETLSSYNPVVLVYASALQDVDKWSEVKSKRTGRIEADTLIEVAKHFEDRVHRFHIGYSVKDVDENDALNIVSKRILRYKASIDTILGDEQLTELRKRIASIVGEELATIFINDLKGTYPFSPVYEEFVRKIIIPSYSREFTNVQHLRDLIKISTVAVAKALEREDSYLVSIAHIEHEDIKHMLNPDIAYEWRRIVDTWSKYVVERVGDVEKVEMIRGALNAIYSKSVTDNVIDLIKILSQRPEAISREDLERRALIATKIILSLVGFVKDEDLKFYSDVLQELKNTPFIHVIEKPEADYYLVSLISNPWQLINNVRESILSNLKDKKGEVDVRKAIDYLALAFVKYQLISRFGDSAQQLNISITSLDSILNDVELRELLNKNVFTVIVLSPIDVVKKVFIEMAGTPEDVSYRELEKMIIEALERNKNELKRLNMFAIVVPEVSKNTLIDLIRKLAEIEACEKVNELTTSNVEKLVEQELVDKKGLTRITYWTGVTEERFKQIIADAVKMIREKIQTFTAQLTISAVQDFVSSFISVFKKVVTYDPETGTFEVRDLNIIAGNEGIRRLDRVFASLPVWISGTIMNGLKICNASCIAEQIKNWIKRSIVSNSYVRDAILQTGKHSISIDGLIDTLTRGWKEIPIKPLSVEAIETGINDLDEVKMPIEDPTIKAITLHIEDRELIIEKVAILPPPPPPPPPRRPIGFKVSGRDKVAILFSYMTIRGGELRELIYKIDSELQFGQKEESKAIIKISGAFDKTVILAQDIRSIINKHMNELTRCEAKIVLKANVEEKKLQEILNKIGLTPDDIVYD
jgi:uncharacterized tellurite resistance protein B-like protein